MRWRRYRRRNGEVRAAAGGRRAADRAQDDDTVKRGGRCRGHTQRPTVRGRAERLVERAKKCFFSLLLVHPCGRASMSSGAPIHHLQDATQLAGTLPGCMQRSPVSFNRHLRRLSRQSPAEPAVCLLSAAVAQQRPIAVLPTAQGNRR
jgi:hypothetical protein